ncbi:MAG: hypothetical protein VKI81_11755, partial [Synechococcaceae cyanobacterium]|nr:hypothetical protein [Synechococcaceae cyanobacterium]
MEIAQQAGSLVALQDGSFLGRCPRELGGDESCEPHGSASCVLSPEVDAFRCEQCGARGSAADYARLAGLSLDSAPAELTEPAGQHSKACERGLEHRWPEPPDPSAFTGLAGEVVHTVSPHTEADPAALLIQLLIAFGSAVGRGPHYMVESARHSTNLFAVIVGSTSKGRKGTSWSHVRKLIDRIDPEWSAACIAQGLSSGEGLMWAVRDEIRRREAIKEKKRVVDYQDVIDDPGVSDKRLLVIESEFASVLRVAARDGNTLSPIIRQAWDTGDLRSLTKNSPCRATGAHISIIGHVTKSELNRYLDRTEIGNGFANRFLWVCAKRSKILPDGGCLEPAALNDTVLALAAAVRFARTLGDVGRDDA